MGGGPEVLACPWPVLLVRPPHLPDPCQPGFSGLSLDSPTTPRVSDAEGTPEAVGVEEQGLSEGHACSAAEPPTKQRPSGRAAAALPW